MLLTVLCFLAGIARPFFFFLSGDFIVYYLLFWGKKIYKKEQTSRVQKHRSLLSTRQTSVRYRNGVMRFQRLQYRQEMERGGQSVQSTSRRQMESYLSQIDGRWETKDLYKLMWRCKDVAGVESLKEAGDGVRLNISRLTHEHVVLIYETAVELREMKR